MSVKERDKGKDYGNETHDCWGLPRFASSMKRHVQWAREPRADLVYRCRRNLSSGEEGWRVRMYVCMYIRHLFRQPPLSLRSQEASSIPVSVKSSQVKSSQVKSDKGISSCSTSPIRPLLFGPILVPRKEGWCVWISTGGRWFRRLHVQRRSISIFQLRASMFHDFTVWYEFAVSNIYARRSNTAVGAIAGFRADGTRKWRGVLVCGSGESFVVLTSYQHQVLSQVCSYWRAHRVAHYVKDWPMTGEEETSCNKQDELS